MFWHPTRAAHAADGYRCANNRPGPDHPTVRWKAEELEQAVVDDLASLRLPTPEIATWFRSALQAAVLDVTSYQRRQVAALTKRKAELTAMQDRLLGGRFVARFKQLNPARDPRFGLFEPHFERRKSSHHKEKAVRRFRRTAYFGG